MSAYLGNGSSSTAYSDTSNRKFIKKVKVFYISHHTEYGWPLYVSCRFHEATTATLLLKFILLIFVTWLALVHPKIKSRQHNKTRFYKLFCGNMKFDRLPPNLVQKFLVSTLRHPRWCQHQKSRSHDEFCMIISLIIEVKGHGQMAAFFNLSLFHFIIRIIYLPFCYLM